MAFNISLDLFGLGVVVCKIENCPTMVRPITKRIDCVMGKKHANFGKSQI